MCLLDASWRGAGKVYYLLGNGILPFWEWYITILGMVYYPCGNGNIPFRPTYAGLPDSWWICPDLFTGTRLVSVAYRQPFPQPAGDEPPEKYQ